MQKQFIQRRKDRRSAPLSYAQQRLWVLDQLEPNSPRYNVSRALRLRGSLDLTVLQKSLDAVVSRHETLRSTFRETSGIPLQVIGHPVRVSLIYLDLSDAPVSGREIRLASYLNEQVGRPYDLSSDLMLRASLVRLSPCDHVLLLILPHITADGWSMILLCRELITHYDSLMRGRPCPLVELPIQYGDFAAWQHEWLRDEILDRHLSYWSRALEGISHLQLSADHNRPALPSRRNVAHSVTYAKTLTDRLNGLARAERTTLFMTLLAAFNALLFRYTGQDDLAIGGRIANRPYVELEGLIGLFANTLVFRNNLSGNPTFRELLGRVRTIALEAYEHQDLPFDKLVEKLLPGSDLSRSPLVQVTFQLRNYPNELVQLSDLTIEPFELHTAIARFDLSLAMATEVDGLRAEIEYNPDLFESATIARMCGHFQVLLEGITADPDRCIAELPILTGPERHQLLVDWNGTKKDYLKDYCIHRLFEAQAEKTPLAVAVVFENQQITYRELNARSNQLAHYLRKLGVGAEVLVGICLERSIEMVVGLLGILKAGGAYVPLDPDYPRERLDFMLEDAQVRVLLTQRQFLSRINHQNVVCLDSDWDKIATQSTNNPKSDVTAANLAYVIYTSGSTGKPKGVMIEHGSVVNLLASMARQPGLSETDILLAVTTLSFDMSGLDMYLPLTVGARIVLARRDIATDGLRLAELLSESGATAMQATPATWRMLLAAGWQGCRDLKILCGGEALADDLAKQLVQRCDSLWNMYGPTETTIYSSLRRVAANFAKVTLGRPLDNTQLYILDGNLQPVPIGVSGEIYIGGDGLARGYLNRTDLTTETFIGNPFSNEPGARLYKTGDLARYLPNGNIEFLGRIDHQVKIRGYRIELGEIEAVLAQHRSIKESVVMARDDSLGGQRLVAYVVADAASVPSVIELRGSLQHKLSEYMVPAAFVFLDSLPLTPNGKLDRSALPAPGKGRPKLDETYSPPETPIEALLTQIWAEVLTLDQVGVHDNFFALGGDSLRATQIIARLRNILSKELCLSDIFSNGTIAELADSLTQRTAKATALSEKPILPIGRDRRLPLSFSQERVWFIQQLHPPNIAYHFQSLLYFTGRLDVDALERTLNEIVRRHEIYRTTFPEIEGDPIQEIHSPFSVSLPVLNLQEMPDDEREAVLQKRIKEETQKPFDLNKLPLVRWSLVQLKIDEFVLIHVEHHLVHDGWSFNVFRRELLEIYKAYAAGEASPLPQPRLQFADFALWQRQWMEGETARRQLAYWKQQLRGIPSTFALATDHPRPPIPSFRGAAPRFAIPRALGDSLRALSRERGVTLFMTMFSAFVALLYRYTHQEDIIVGTGVGNRGWKESEGLLGMLVNNVVLRANPAATPNFIDLLEQVKGVALDAYANDDIPFDHVVRALHLDRDDSRNPIFQIMFNFHDAPLIETSLPGIDFKCVEVISNQSAKFDLNVIVIPRREPARANSHADSGMTLIWEYNSDLFEAATITRMVGHYFRLLEEIIADPFKCVSDYSMVTGKETQELLQSFNRTRHNYPDNKRIQELFGAQAAKSPDAVAVVFADQQLTYRELDRRANQLAHYLRTRGVGPDVLVGICMERSLEMIVGLLGVLKAGGAYVPLDPAYPKERLGFILQDTQAGIVLTDAASLVSLPPTGARLICLDRDWKEAASKPQDHPMSPTTADSLAYVIYTSGTTGLPKGVEVSHRSVVRLLFGVDYVRLDGTQTLLHLAPLSFDAATFEVWGALLHGGRCVLFPGKAPSPGELGEVLKKHRVNTLWLTAALFNTVIDQEPQALSEVKQLLIGGDTLSVPHVKKGLAGLPDTEIINGYGPTESTTFACCYPVPRQLDDNVSSIPIGKPIGNTQVYILDPHLNPVPIGALGELHIGGDGLARGYRNRTDLTAEKFIGNPFSNEAGARLYKTGDLARYLPDGNIEFLGRIDHQVKIRGYRIEPGEVEAVLAQHPAIQQAVVIAREDTPGDKRLVAYVVTANGSTISVHDLRRFLQHKLPDYMVPSAFLVLNSLPLTRNGKLDRKALPAPDQSRHDLEDAFTAPRTPVEVILANIWSQVLKLDKVGIHDNFFHLGGHSLLATQVVSRIRDAFKVDLTLRTLFEAPTIEGIVQKLQEIRDKQEVPPTAHIAPAAREQYRLQTTNH